MSCNYIYTRASTVPARPADNHIDDNDSKKITNREEEETQYVMNRQKTISWLAYWLRSTEPDNLFYFGRFEFEAAQCARACGLHIHLVALGVWEVALGRDGRGAFGVGRALELVPVVGAEAAEIGVSQRVAAPLARRPSPAGRALVPHRARVDPADLAGLARREEQSQQRHDRHGHDHGLVDAHPSPGHRRLGSIDKCLVGGSCLALCV